RDLAEAMVLAGGPSVARRPRDTTWAKSAGGPRRRTTTDGRAGRDIRPHKRTARFAERTRALRDDAGRGRLDRQGNRGAPRNLRPHRRESCPPDSREARVPVAGSDRALGGGTQVRGPVTKRARSQSRDI